MACAVGLLPFNNLCSRSPEALVSFTQRSVDSIIKCSKQRSATHHPLPELDQFIQQICERTRVTPCVLVVALLYLRRLKQRLTKSQATGSFDTPYRLFLASILVASKYVEDESFTNVTIATSTKGIYDSRDVNLMERCFLGLIKFDLYIDAAEVKEFVDIYGAELEVAFEQR